MSIVRILIGLLIGVVTFSVTIVIAQQFHIHLAAAALAWCVAVGATYDFHILRKSRQALAQYWQRRCTGGAWKKRFPNAPKTSIRAFLEIFVVAFMFPRQQLKFTPDDRIMDVYRAIYPDRSAPDNCELETLVQLCKDRYGIDVVPSWHENITLGELYATVTSP